MKVDEPLSGTAGAASQAFLERNTITARHRQRTLYYALYVVAVVGMWLQPLIRLMWHSVSQDLHSHIVLVPLVVAYLLYAKSPSFTLDCSTSWPGAATLFAVSLAALGARYRWLESLSVNDELALAALSFVSAIAAGGFLFLGAGWMAAAAFPLSFSLFMIPMPDRMATALELASVQASADVSAALFRMTGTPLIRDGTLFGLPGILIRVAQECSGIRSSWVLFITSLVASHLFLRSPWRRVGLVVFVIPLGIVRNAFRILVIGLLCVHVGPEMIDSPIHHQGGPLFFVLSLVPLYLLLWWLRRGEATR